MRAAERGRGSRRGVILRTKIVSFVRRWRVPARPSPAVVVIAIAAWVVVVTTLHASVNGRRPVGRAAEARSLPVGGLPVT